MFTIWLQPFVLSLSLSFSLSLYIYIYIHTEYVQELLERERERERGGGTERQKKNKEKSFIFIHIFNFRRQRRRQSDTDGSRGTNRCRSHNMVKMSCISTMFYRYREPSGLTLSNSSWPVWGLPWGWVTSGDFPTWHSKMEEVSL